MIETVTLLVGAAVADLVALRLTDCDTETESVAEAVGAIVEDFCGVREGVALRAIVVDGV